MKKFYYIFLFFILIISTSISFSIDTNLVDISVPEFTDIKKLLKATDERPDLRVKYLQQNPHLWIDDPRTMLTLSESLNKIGRFQESLGLGYHLLLSSLSYFHRGKNYFTIAKNHAGLQNTSKVRYYMDKAITRNNQYYYFYYARFEEYEQNFPISIEYYQKALNHKYGAKDYILAGYSRALNSALIYYKNRDKELYRYYYNLIKNNPHLPQGKARIINNAIVW